LIKVGSSEYIWLWVIIEPKDKEILEIDISKERNMFLYQSAFSITYCKRIWSTFCFNRDGGTWYPPQANNFLKVEHHIHSPFDKSIIERTM